MEKERNSELPPSRGPEVKAVGTVGLVHVNAHVLRVTQTPPQEVSCSSGLGAGPVQTSHSGALTERARSSSLLHSQRAQGAAPTCGGPPL